jgi:hypothetical protein
LYTDGFGAAVSDERLVPVFVSVPIFIPVLVLVLAAVVVPPVPVTLLLIAIAVPELTMWQTDFHFPLAIISVFVGIPAVVIVVIGVANSYSGATGGHHRSS